MSQVLQPNEGDSRSRKWAWWWLGGVLTLVAILVAGGWQLAGGEDPWQVLGAGAGKSQPPSGPGTQVLGSQANRPELLAPTIVSGPAEGQTSPSTVTFTYSHPRNGVNFACSLDNSPFARCPSGGITYRNLTAAPHFFAVAVQQGNGPLSPPASRNWTVGAPQPGAPPATVITVGPPASTIDPDATFIFTNQRAGVTFECRLDSGTFSACASPKSYVDLGVGPHTFFVRAVDGIGTGPVAQHSWTIVTAGFGISGSLTAQQLLAPGMTWPLDLEFTNPFNNAEGINIIALDIKVNDLTMRDGEPNPDCIGSENVIVDPKTAWSNINLPPRSTAKLSDRVSNSESWPQVTMRNLDSNQDACKNSVFTFSYTGTAEK